MLERLTEAAKLDGIEVYLSIYNFGSKTTPLTERGAGELRRSMPPSSRARCPTSQNFIIGNEPNLNRFWLPQFNSDGTDAAAPAYLALLSRTYQALKAVDADDHGVRRRALAARHRPRRARSATRTRRPSSSPTSAPRTGRAAGRRPMMDALAIHPYADNSSVPPANGRTRRRDDRDRRLRQARRRLLGKAFDGTGQPGSTLPILYAEFGVETQIPAAKAGLYTGTEPATTKPSTEAIAGARTTGTAMQMAFCQPNVTGLLLFHAFDETALDRCQSGLYYPDGTPKSSLAVVRAAARDVARRRDREVLRPAS